MPILSAVRIKTFRDCGKVFALCRLIFAFRSKSCYGWLKHVLSLTSIIVHCFHRYIYIKRERLRHLCLHNAFARLHHSSPLQTRHPLATSYSHQIPLFILLNSQSFHKIPPPKSGGRRSPVATCRRRDKTSNSLGVFGSANTVEYPLWCSFGSCIATGH